MTRNLNIARTGATVALIGLGAGSALAGGFAVREQSALSEGASFAGAAANGTISSMFWNSAGVTTQNGLNTNSNITAILPTATETALTGSTFVPATGAPQSTDIGHNAYVPASYANFQLTGYDPRMYIGIGVNSGFGLRTEPDKNWAGSNIAGSTRLFTVDFNPVLGYKFSDSIAFGIGVQIEYAKGVFKFATGSGPTAWKGPATSFEGTDLALGATAGLLYTPSPSTSIGLGWRSAITHQLDGQFATGGSVIPAVLGGGVLNPRLNTGVASRVELRLPDIVTLSLNQAIAPSTRALGTIEWTNWSRFGGLEVISTGSGLVITQPIGLPQVLGAPNISSGQSIAKINAPWQDGWFFSGGLEYDVSKQLTVRAGGAYEISPVTSATARLAAIPDADRIWASLGFSYAVSQSTTLDFGYSHLFVDKVQIDEKTVTGTARLVAGLDASIDIVTLGLRMKLGQ